MTCCTRRAKPGFYQYETASLHIELDAPGVLNDTADVVLSIQQGTVQVDYHKDALEIDEDACTIDVEMSQEDAGKFSAARVLPPFLLCRTNHAKRARSLPPAFGRGVYLCVCYVGVYYACLQGTRRRGGNGKRSGEAGASQV